MNQNNNLRRNVLYNTVGNIIYFVCQWLVTGLFVKTLSGADGITNAGLLTTAMSVTAVFLSLSSFGMRTFQVSDIDESYSSSTYLLSRAITYTVAVLLCVGFSLVSGYRGVQERIILIMLFYRLLESLTDVFHGFCQRSERMDCIGISYAVRGIAGTLVFAAAMLLGVSFELSLALMTLVCYLFSVFYDILGTKKYYLPLEKTTLKPVGSLLLECLPLAAYVFLNTATASIPKLFLERMLGGEMMGIYGLVSSPVMLIQVGAAFLFTPFITTFARKLHSGDKSGFRKLAAVISLGLLALGVICCVGARLVGHWGLNLLYGEQVAQYASLLIPLVVCSVLTALSLFLCMLLTVLRARAGLIISNLAGIAAAALLSTPMINHFGLFGTAYASAASLVVTCVFLCLFGLQKLK